ncbi:MAG: AMP-binding protein [Burkholderiales bacterium]|nr:AMP-binding protein [Burkholderiales bacterium]
MNALGEFLSARDFLLAHRDDYDTAYREFNWPRLTQFNWALDYFDPMARDNNAPALWLIEQDGREFKASFEALRRRSNQVARFLDRQGVARGDRILLMLGNEAALWETMLAAMKLGAVVVPCTAMLGEDDLLDRIDRGRVRHLVVGAAHTGKFDRIANGLTKVAVGSHVDGWLNYVDDTANEDEAFRATGVTRADDPLLLYFTSGTTSKPKLVMHTHQSYPVGHLSTMYWIGLHPGDVHWNISSPGWAKHAWSSFFAPWNAGACVFSYNYTRFNARDVLATLSGYPVTTLCAPPTVWRMLVQEPLQDYPNRLRELVGAGEPLNPEVIEQVRRAWGITLRDGYGQTETTAQIANSPGQRVKPGSVGRPLPGYRIELLDADDQPAQEGEIAIDLSHSPLSLMQGYEGDAGKTADATRNGFYRTGDVASVDEDGYLTFVGRSDDVFKASDYRISPFELESVLIMHEAVAEVAIVPSPDPVRHAVPKAYIALAAGYAPSAALAKDLFAFARAHLAPYKRIRRLEFYELPKTVSGKIRRVDLRRREEARAAGSLSVTDFTDEGG